MSVNVEIKRDWHGRLLRRLSLNENYFEKIDSFSKAYWLGFLTADGCLDKKKNVVRLDLAIKDEAQVIKFKQALKSGHKLYYYNKENRHSVALAISCKKMYEDLKNKLITNNMIKLDFNLISHFIRGIFDGDGCVYYVPLKKAIRICLLGEKTMLEQIQLNSPLQYPKPNKIQKSVGIYDLRINGLRAINFLHWIYNKSNSKNRLDRKYFKFKNLLNRYKEEHK